MIKIDRDGLTLCKLQGELFENSIKYVNQSSSIFIRRFMNSNIARTFDSKDILNDTKPFEMIYEIIDDEFGKSEYGSKKFGSESLFWIGYIYRYFSYTYNLSSKQVYKMIKPDELNERYYVYHTFDPAFAIERMLEEKNISLSILPNNTRSIHVFEKIGFKEIKEDNNFIWFEKII